MSIDRKTRAFVKELQQAYFEMRDTDKILSMATEDVLWSGLYHSNINERGGLEAVLKADFSRFPCPFTILDTSVETRVLSDTHCLADCQLRLRADTPAPPAPEVQLSGSLVCSLVDGELRLRQLHIARIDGSAHLPGLSQNLLTASDPHIQHFIEKTTRELEARSQDLQQLTENIPGGIFRCLYDEKLTILQVNDGFLSMFGYTRAEIRERFDDSFIAIIDPRDRSSTLLEVKRQLRQKSTKQIEYRATRSDGSTIWILDKGQLIKSESGPDSFYCILIDDTVGKEAQENLRLSLERHEIIMDQTTDIIFEWDIKKDTLIFSHNWQKKFGYEPMTENISTDIVAHSHILPSDIPAFTGILEDIRQGSPYVETEVRIKKADALYIWCRIRITAQYDENCRPFKAVGVIVDIDSEKRHSQELMQKAERDALTKLYNKGTTESIIENHLSRCPENSLCALLIIDIDDFKIVNDTRGHLFGDAFLMEIAGKIQTLFRSGDVVGRIGGDEFIAFIRDIPDMRIATEKARQVIENFHSLDVFNEDDAETSCSIGIACYPDHARDFHELYKRADYALYQAKRQGKNQYVIFDRELEDMALKNAVLGAYSAVNERIDSDSEVIPQTVNSQLVEYVFRILYKSIDIESAVHPILEIVGRQFDVSRVYIFENSEDDTHCTNTFEWCNDGVAPEIQNLSHVSYETDLGGIYLDNFDENGIFYCRDVASLPKDQFDILAPQGIKSLLQCAIRDNGRFKGYVGFDECRNNRFWTQEQIAALSFISEILSTFLLKKRAQDRVEQSAAAMKTVLDNQNSWIYVIEPGTYRLLYINQKTQDLVPSSEVGMCCYEAFFDRTAPCARCPARSVGTDRKNCTMEIYNPLLRVWSSADASLITWKNLPACLLSCHDITRYKENQK